MTQVSRGALTIAQRLVSVVDTSEPDREEYLVKVGLDGIGQFFPRERTANAYAKRIIYQIALAMDEHARRVLEAGRMEVL
jgi:hypothetical protein